MTLLTTLLRATDFKSSPFLSNLVPATLAAFSVQFVFGTHGVLRRSEFLYDFSGGWTFFATLATAFYLPALRRDGATDLAAALAAANWRQVFMTGAAAVYSARRMAPFSYP